MTDTGIGALGYFGFAKETVEGTAVNPLKYLAINSVNFDYTNDYLSPLQVRGSRDATVAMPAPRNVTGTTELLLPTDNIALWLQEAFAATYVTSAYAGGYGYQHVFTPGNSSYTATVTTSHQDVLVSQYTGVRVNTFEIRATYGEIVAATMGLTGIAASDYGGTFVPSYATTSCTPLHFTGATVLIGGSLSAEVKDFTFTVNNNVSQIGTLRATRDYYRVAMGPREIGLAMTMDFTSDDEMDRAMADSEFAVTLLLQGAALTGGTALEQLKIELPRVKYRRVGIPINAGDFLSQDVECTVLKPCSAAAIATVTLVSNDATVIPA